MDDRGSRAGTRRRMGWFGAMAVLASGGSAIAQPFWPPTAFVVMPNCEGFQGDIGALFESVWPVTCHPLHARLDLEGRGLNFVVEWRPDSRPCLNAVTAYQLQATRQAIRPGRYPTFATVYTEGRLHLGPTRMGELVIGCTCPADFDDGTGLGVPDGGVTINDAMYFFDGFFAGSLDVDMDDGSGTGMHDGGVTIDDVIYFLERFSGGC